MKIEIFARSPGLILGGVSVLGGRVDLAAIDLTREEQAQRVAKLSTGSPSLTYEIELLQERSFHAPASRFGLHTDGGLVIRDGYQFSALDTPRHEAIVPLPDGYYAVEVFVAGEQAYGRMRLALCFRPSATPIAGCGGIVDHIVP